MAALIRPSSGEVLWFGEKTSGQHASRRLIGMVAHENRLYPHLTLRENLVFAARMCDVARPQHRAESLLETVGLLGARRSHAAGALEGHAAAAEPRPGVDPRSADPVVGRTVRGPRCRRRALADRLASGTAAAGPDLVFCPARRGEDPATGRSRAVPPPGPVAASRRGAGAAWPMPHNIAIQKTLLDGLERPALASAARCGSGRPCCCWAWSWP